MTLEHKQTNVIPILNYQEFYASIEQTITIYTFG